jgi:hypothetical protein
MPDTWEVWWWKQNIWRQRSVPHQACLMLAGLAVLLNVAAGVVIGLMRVLPKNTFSILNGFVFKVALPALVLRGLGIKTDLYEDGIWRFIGAFLILRVIALAISGITAFRLQCVPLLHAFSAPLPPVSQHCAQHRIACASYCSWHPCTDVAGVTWRRRHAT